MSKIEVNQVSSQCGSTLTIGQSGDTVQLASGATQTGFGRTGTVDWNTTPKTANFTAVSGDGYFVNTTSGAVTMTMPSGSAGAIVSIQDYNKTFDTNALTVTPASGERINGGEAGASLSIATEGQGLTFVYVDSTVGWKTVHENDFTAGGTNFIVATGGTVTTCGDCKIHTFTGPGTFCVTAGGSPTNAVVSYLVVAGGGSGALDNGGGGGAGGFREYKSPVTPYTASPLDGNPGGTSVSIAAGAYPITVGAGAPVPPGPSSPIGVEGGDKGTPSVFSTITSAGGGGGSHNGPTTPSPVSTSDMSGGSGGGGGQSTTSGQRGDGNTPPVTPSQGNPGGNNGPLAAAGGGGGGGAGAAGSSSPGSTNGQGGGAGVSTSISGSSTSYAGGGGGGAGQPGSGSGGPGGTGGGGAGGPGSSGGTAGTANTGGGGGGAGQSGPGSGSGGSGIVIIRYKYQ